MAYIEPTSEILAFATNAFQLTQPLRFLRKVENFVYESMQNNSPVILRIVDPEHRTKAEMHAELDWINYLCDNGFKAARPLPSRHGNFVETLQTKTECFHASLFVKVEGKILTEVGDFSTDVLQKIGACLGKMHRLTRDYTLPTEASRPSIYSDRSFLESLEHPDSEKDPERVYRECDTWIATLPRDKNSFGLIHGDLHRLNFFINQGDLVAFDFDDSCFHWYAADISVSIYSILNYANEQNFSSSLFNYTNVYDAVLAGYTNEYSLDSFWYEQIPRFIQHRYAIMYLWGRNHILKKDLPPEALAWFSEFALPNCLEKLRL